MGISQAQLSHPESRKKRQKATNPGLFTQKTAGLMLFSPFPARYLGVELR
jgi:hypothetical protein